ncbi:MAG: multidrug ABC transporter substrate-binding protein [Candidatus Dadabacteria bacterium]
MNPWAAFKVSYKTLKKNKVRSILTTLGIIIGVASVITMIALTQGAKETIEQQITSLGGTSIVIDSGSKTRSGVTMGRGWVDTLTPGDAEAIRQLPMVTYVSPTLKTTRQVVWGNRNWFTAIVGASPDFVHINDWFPERGNFFIQDDVLNADMVCVLGKSVALNLFGYQDPIGEAIRIGSNSFRVIGVLSSKGQTPGGSDQDDIVVIPYTTLQKRIMGVTTVGKITLSVRTQRDVPIAQAQIAQLLRERHQIRPGIPDDFSIKTQIDITQRIFTISKVMTILLGSIASISLIVGGIGIMNIMLVSVTERTKEIGIRISVGAREKDILLQFLIEALVLSLIGGLIGIVVGVVGSKVASFFTRWPALVSFGSIMLAFSFAVVVGIFFGLYPAKKASKLDPIEALRYE